MMNSAATTSLRAINYHALRAPDSNSASNMMAHPMNPMDPMLMMNQMAHPMNLNPMNPMDSMLMNPMMNQTLMPDPQQSAHFMSMSRRNSAQPMTRLNAQPMVPRPSIMDQHAQLMAQSVQPMAQRHTLTAPNTEGLNAVLNGYFVSLAELTSLADRVVPAGTAGRVVYSRFAKGLAVATFVGYEGVEIVCDRRDLLFGMYTNSFILPILVCPIGVQ